MYVSILQVFVKVLVFEHAFQYWFLTKKASVLVYLEISVVQYGDGFTTEELMLKPDISTVKSVAECQNKSFFISEQWTFHL